MPRPASVLVADDRAVVIRRAETLEDVFVRDELPEHLAPAETAEPEEQHATVTPLVAKG